MAPAYAFAYGVNTLIFVPSFIRRGLASRELLWSRSVLTVWAPLVVAEMTLGRQDSRTRLVREYLADLLGRIKRS